MNVLKWTSKLLELVIPKLTHSTPFQTPPPKKGFSFKKGLASFSMIRPYHVLTGGCCIYTELYGKPLPLTTVTNKLQSSQLTLGQLYYSLDS